MNEPSAYQMTQMYFNDAAEEYLEFLKKEHPEHFMLSVAQATQRHLTDTSLDFVAAERPDMHVYSELLIQWRDEKNKMRRVVPDNMVVLAEKKPKVNTNFAIPIQATGPFMVFENWSKDNPRKDYQKSYDKYEAELKVPYFLRYYADDQKMSLLEFDKRKDKYVSVQPDDEGRCAIPELDLTVGLLDGWVRFWWKGQLMPTVVEWYAGVQKEQKEVMALAHELDIDRRIIEMDRLIADQDRQIADMQAELERLRKSAG